MRKSIVFCLLLFISVVSQSQSKNHWKENNAPDRVKTDKSVARVSFPKVFKTFDLNIPAFEQELMSIAGKNRITDKIKVTFPNADGGIEEFELVEASNFEPALQERFPEIRAYSGRGITDPYATIKVSLSPDGVQTMTFRADKENEFIEKFSEDKKTYAVFRSQRKPGALPWDCTTKAEEKMVSSINDQVMTLNTNVVARSGNNLKTMRLAQSCNAEYSIYFGATSSAQVGLVLAAFNATLTRCNGIYEKDLALHLNLINNTEKVIYYNASTDPYTTMSSWNSQLQNTLDTAFGTANYDIGHLFGSTGGGGNAGCIGCICEAKKGSGITSPADGIPKGDNFDIDYVAHEVGHQLGANHTFSQTLEGTGVNMEVGSGITIMGYAGITSYDVAPHSIDIFHQASIAQIQNNLNGKTCPVTTPISNLAPTVTLADTLYSIPKSTPFALTANATDATANGLTYCWEQNDNSTVSGSSSIASITKASGPNWISFSPSTSPTRYFPILRSILAGKDTTGTIGGNDATVRVEALSSVTRDLKFRVTARDNVSYDGSNVGQTNFADLRVKVIGTAGPFGVTVPNTAVSWAGGSTQTVTWSVNSTNLAPISCSTVNILLSTDGGLTFPITLVSGTSNDGSQSLTLPILFTTRGRIKVEAEKNIFFDISNTNFTITGTPTCGTPTGLTSTPSKNSANLSWAAVSGASSYRVEYKVSTASTWITSQTANTSNSASLSGLTAGTAYKWRITSNCSAGGESKADSATFTTLPNCDSPSGMTTSGAIGNVATLSWAAVDGASGYNVQYKLSTTSTWTTATSPTTNSIKLSGLTAGATYNWQVQTKCSAGTGIYVPGPNFFTLTAACSSIYDNSTNNAYNTAPATIPYITPVKGVINVGSDIDIYKLIVSTAGTITLSLIVPKDYNLDLLSSTGTLIVSSKLTGTTTEAINNRTIAAGTYFAKVYPSTTKIFDAGNCYTLTVTLGGAATRLATDITGSANGVIIDQSEGNEKINAYPNPVKDLLNINMSSAGNTMQLFNSRGTMVLQAKAIGTNGQLDVSRLTPGLYLVKISKEGRLISQLKVVKQ
jgi:hypothetical protein